MKYARINNGQVLEIIEPPEGYDISNCYHADIVKTCERIYDQDVQIGWTFSNGVFSAPIVEEPAPTQEPDATV